MTEYMKEVLNWMFGKKSEACPEDVLSGGAKKFHKKEAEVFARCAPHITDEDIVEARHYCSENHGGY